MARKRPPTADQMAPEIIRLARILIETRGEECPMEFIRAKAGAVGVSETDEDYPSIPRSVKEPSSLTVTVNIDGVGRIACASIGTDDNIHVISNAKTCRVALQELRRALPLESLATL